MDQKEVVANEMGRMIQSSLTYLLFLGLKSVMLAFLLLDQSSRELEVVASQLVKYLLEVVR